MSFGKYLVENGVVTSEQLVDAVTVQMESLPSIIRIVRKKNMLNCKEIVELIDKSIDEKKNIMELITESSMFNKNEMDDLLKDRYRAGKGLCEILVREGHASSMIVSEYVKKYLKHQDNRLNNENKDGGIRGVLDFDIRGEFVKIFDRDLFNRVNADIENIKTKEREQHIFSIRRELTLLVTVAGMGHLKYIMDFLQIWLEVLDRSAGIKDNGHWNEVVSGLKHMMDLIWTLRERYVEEGIGKDMLEDDDWKRKYGDGMRRAEYLLKDCQNNK